MINQISKNVSFQQCTACHERLNSKTLMLILFHEYALSALRLALWLVAIWDKAPWLPGKAVNAGPAQTEAVGLSASATIAASTPCHPGWPRQVQSRPNDPAHTAVQVTQAAPEASGQAKEAQKRQNKKNKRKNRRIAKISLLL